MPQENTQPITARLAIWSPGTYTSISGDQFTFTDEDVADIAEGYSPGAFAAPMVIGHPKTDDPAQGWADALEFDGETLWADANKIDPDFAEAHRAGRYAKISPRFFMPDEPGNPTPGKFYLRHIGFLGAVAPANKALPMADFAEGEGTVTFADLPKLPACSFSDGAPRWGFKVLRDMARRLREFLIEKEGIETANQLAPEHLISALDEAGSDEPERLTGFSDPTDTLHAEEEPMADELTQEQLAEQHAQLQRDQAAFADQQAAFAEQQANAHQESCAAFAEELADQGRILPADTGFISALLAGIPKDAECSFAEGDAQVTTATGERLRSFLSGLPRQVDYQEHAPAQQGRQVKADFAAPDGYTVDLAAADLRNRAKAYQDEHGCSFEEAVAQVQ